MVLVIITIYEDNAYSYIVKTHSVVVYLGIEDRKRKIAPIKKDLKHVKEKHPMTSNN